MAPASSLLPPLMYTYSQLLRRSCPPSCDPRLFFMFSYMLNCTAPCRTPSDEGTKPAHKPFRPRVSYTCRKPKDMVLYAEGWLAPRSSMRVLTTQMGFVQAPVRRPETSTVSKLSVFHQIIWPEPHVPAIILAEKNSALPKCSPFARLLWNSSFRLP
jgi:hypothetical protein